MGAHLVNSVAVTSSYYLNLNYLDAPELQCLTNSTTPQQQQHTARDHPRAMSIAAGGVSLVPFLHENHWLHFHKLCPARAAA